MTGRSSLNDVTFVLFATNRMTNQSNPSNSLNHPFTCYGFQACLAYVRNGPENAFPPTEELKKVPVI